MTIKISIDKGLSDYIESLQFEVNRTKEIVAYMLNNNYDISSKAFQEWDKDNQKVYAEFCTAKNNLEHEVIPKLLPEGAGAIRSWNLDFYTHEVTVKAADAPKN